MVGVPKREVAQRESEGDCQGKASKSGDPYQAAIGLNCTRYPLLVAGPRSLCDVSNCTLAEAQRGERSHHADDGNIQPHHAKQSRT